MSRARERQAAQIAKAEELQDLLLDHWTKLARNGELTAADSANIARLLSGNGWSLDPALIPTELRSKLTSEVKFDDGVEDEPQARPRLVG